jgi:hypothetical protein
MERYNIKAIALGITLTAGVGTAGCQRTGDVIKSNHQEIAASLRQDCPDDNKPTLYEVYTRPARPPENIEELITGKIQNELTGLMVSCEPDSGTVAK